MRDRLIELIKQGDKTFDDKYKGKIMMHIDELYDFKYLKYCHGCGAKMDERRDT